MPGKTRTDMNTPGKIKMPRKSSKNEVVDWTDHVFEFRKGGITYEVRHRVYTDQSDGKKKISNSYIATKEEIKDRAAGGYRPYLDGKPYKV